MRWLSAGMHDRLGAPERHPASRHGGAWLLTGLALLQAAGGVAEAAMLIVALEAKLLSMRSWHMQGLQPGKLHCCPLLTVSELAYCECRIVTAHSSPL